jgi:hypothetical protein
MRLATENLFPLFAQPLSGSEDLTPAETRDVLLVLGEVANQLARATNSAAGLRRRLDAIAGAIVAFMDQIDGDPDLEEQCEDEGSQCDDEGDFGDNGIADPDGQAEQWGHRHLYGGWVT